MPVYNVTMLAQQAQRLMEEDNKTETEAIKTVLEQGGISEEEATENDLQQRISELINRDTEQETEAAEKQLDQQTEEGFQAE